MTARRTRFMPTIARAIARKRRKTAGSACRRGSSSTAWRRNHRLVSGPRLLPGRRMRCAGEATAAARWKTKSLRVPTTSVRVVFPAKAGIQKKALSDPRAEVEQLADPLGCLETGSRQHEHGFLM